MNGMKAIFWGFVLTFVTTFLMWLMSLITVV